MDSSDQAIEGAYIENTGSPRAITSDASGHFRLSTRAPSFVVRKEGYNSVFVRTTSANPVVVTLTQSRYSAPRCPNKSACDSVAGFGARFCFPRVEGVKVSKQVNDVDYGQRTFSVRAKHGRGTISYGSGPQWSLGWPPDEDVWRSVEYRNEYTRRRAPRFWTLGGKRRTGSSGVTWGRLANQRPTRALTPNQPPCSTKCSMVSVSSTTSNGVDPSNPASAGLACHLSGKRVYQALGRNGRQFTVYLPRR